jgi:serine/threonine protein kinase
MSCYSIIDPRLSELRAIQMRSQLRTARSGQVIAGRYELRAPLGRGAMGTVWRAEHLRLRTPVAIKFLDGAIAQDPEMAERFMREAQSAAVVRSSHVVQIFDYGVEDAVGTLSVRDLSVRDLSVRDLSVGEDSIRDLAVRERSVGNLGAASRALADVAAEPDGDGTNGDSSGVELVVKRAGGSDGKNGAQGTPYIVMELLNGESLEARLAERGRLDPFELDKVFSEVARAVNNAHDLGVVHRDLTPSNIFLAREGKDEVTKVLDFGIAKIKLDAPGIANASATRSGIFMGTPRYMSPEQVRSTRDVDHCTDLWSLGVVAFECLTGRCPFVGEATGELLVQICTAEPLVPSEVADVPSGFDAWFLKATSKEKSARFTSAREMADALHLVLEHAPRPSPGEGRATVRQPAVQHALVLVNELRVRTLDAWYRAQRSLRGGVVAPLCVAGVAASVLGWYALPRPRPEAEQVLSIDTAHLDSARPDSVPLGSVPRGSAPPSAARPDTVSPDTAPLAVGRVAPRVRRLSDPERSVPEPMATPAASSVAPAPSVDIAPESLSELQRALANGGPKKRPKQKAHVAPVHQGASSRKSGASVSRALPAVPAVSPEARRPPPAVADRPNLRPPRDPFTERP